MELSLGSTAALVGSVRSTGVAIEYEIVDRDGVAVVVLEVIICGTIQKK